MENIEQIIAKYEPLAGKLARNFSWTGIDSEDLKQVARIGFIKAIETYDPERGHYPDGSGNSASLSVFIMSARTLTRPLSDPTKQSASSRLSVVR